jgi:tRNA A37 threonylcarbamoyladenosine modification protein TsaB
LATALGFSLGAGCPVAGVSSFAAKALEAGKEGETVLVSAGAGGGGGGGGDVCYRAAFEIVGGMAAEVVPHGLEAWSAAASVVEAGWILAGEGARRIGELVGENASPSGAPEIKAESVPVATWVGRLGQAIFARDGAAAPEALQPLYLRRSSAEINWDARQRGKK